MFSQHQTTDMTMTISLTMATCVERVEALHIVNYVDDEANQGLVRIHHQGRSLLKAVQNFTKVGQNFQ